MCKTALAILGWTIRGATFGSGTGLVYGSLFGILEGLLQGDPWRLVLDGGYFALCGAVTGAVVGGFGRFIDPAVFAGPTAPWPADPVEDPIVIRKNHLLSWRRRATVPRR